MSTEIFTHQSRNGEQPKRVCVICGKEFRPSRGRGTAKTCSYECGGALDRQKRPWLNVLGVRKK